MFDKTMIPFGRENAISRKDLAAMTGMSDRNVRFRIAELRAEDDGTDEVIVSISRRSGYYRTDNPAEIEHFVNELKKRIRMTYRGIRVAKAKWRRIIARQEYGEGLREPCDL